MIRIGDMGPGVRHSQPDRLHLQVYRSSLVMAHSSKVATLENLESLQHGNSLPVRRHFQELIPTIIGRDWLDPVVRVVSKIASARGSAVRFRKTAYAVRDLGFVKGCCSALDDRAQGPAEIGVSERLTRPRRAAAA